MIEEDELDELELNDEDDELIEEELLLILELIEELLDGLEEVTLEDEEKQLVEIDELIEELDEVKKDPLDDDSSLEEIGISLFKEDSLKEKAALVCP